jgi:hypothetical protein
MGWYKRAQEEKADPAGFTCDGNHCYRIDRLKIDRFKYNPYIMFPTGSSQVASEADRDSRLPKGQAFFSGLYAGDKLKLIAPYAIGRGIPWVMAYASQEGEDPLNLGKEKPTLWLYREHLEQEHPPVFLSKFKKEDFKPRHEITKGMFGEESTDTGDDEFLSVGGEAPDPVEQVEIKGIMPFLKSHVNLREMESGGLTGILAKLEKINSVYHCYSVIATDGRGHTEVIDP